MAADIHNIAGTMGQEFNAFTASSGGTCTGAFVFHVDSDTAATDTPQSKGDVINLLKQLIQYYEENDWPPA